MQFQKIENEWVAEFEATSDFNLHLERAKTGSLIVAQRGTASGEYDTAFVKGVYEGKRVIDYDFGALVYPKYIKVVSGSEVTNCIITCPDGEVTQIVAFKYEFVDLGLPSGTMWATTNVGATKPEENGLYFAWGETEGYTAEDVAAGKKAFTWDDYKFGTKDNLTKYNATDGLTVLALEDDAAYQSDNSCRMPNKDEIQELIDNTTSTWETLNGINGRRFTSNTNGNSIFFPETESEYGCFWSNSIDESSSSSRRALTLYFDSESKYMEFTNRYLSCSIRPVQNK